MLNITVTVSSILYASVQCDNLCSESLKRKQQSLIDPLYYTHIACMVNVCSHHS